MKRFRLALLLLLLVLTGCQSTDNGSQLIKPSSPVILRVAGTSITLADFQKRMEAEIGAAVQRLLDQNKTAAEIIQLADQENVRVSIFDQMIQDEVLLRAARQEGLGVDPAKVEELIAQQTPPTPAGEQAPFTDLTQTRIVAAHREIAAQMILRHTYADMFKARHILVDDEATADEVLAQLKAGKSFTDLAATYSKDSSASTGGDLGWATRGSFVTEFENAGFNTPLNTPVKIQSQFGWHVIEVLERQNNRPFESIKQIEDDITAAQSQNRLSYYESSFKPWLDKVRADMTASGELEIPAGFDPNTVALPRLK